MQLEDPTAYQNYFMNKQNPREQNSWSVLY